MTWRDRILHYFSEPLSPILLVSDPDGLLLDETMLLALEKKHIELLPFEDRAKFRYLYERYYRERKGKSLLIYVRDQSVDHLPFDILQKGQPITLRIGQLIPQFPPSIIGQLDSNTLDALYSHSQGVQGPLSSKETYDFLLRRVFKLPYDSVDNSAEFFRLLIKKHESPLNMPGELDQFLIAHFQKAPFLQSLPVDQLVSSPVEFYQYLEQEWHTYLQEIFLKGEVVREDFRDEYHPPHPFHHPNLRHDLARLFLEGKLEPDEGMEYDLLPDWVSYGVKVNTSAQSEAKLKLLMEQMQEKLTGRPTYKQWLELMPLLAEAKYFRVKYDLDVPQFDQLELTFEEQFQSWMFTEYQALANLPYVHAPIMVHHIPHFLSMHDKRKMALVVIDGMSFLQWRQIRAHLSQAFHCYEQGVFAWVPTMTSVSRQALFSGELPFHFADSINTTHKEASFWQLFWQQQGVPKQRISFEKGLGQGRYQSDGIHAVQNPHIKVAAMVIDTIDRLMHGALQGYKGMMAETDVWLQNGYLEQLIQDLADKGYAVYVTSDHGNKESTGIGRINEGVLAETRGERVRIYRDQKLRDQAAQQYPSIPWPHIGLPQDWFILLAKSGEAFVREGEQVISHGGISMEEVIVPFAHITPK